MIQVPEKDRMTDKAFKVFVKEADAARKAGTCFFGFIETEKSIRSMGCANVPFMLHISAVCQRHAISGLMEGLLKDRPKGEKK